MTAESFLLQHVLGDCSSAFGLAHPIRGSLKLRGSAQHWFGCARWHLKKARPWHRGMKFLKAMRPSPRPRAIFRSVLLRSLMAAAGRCSVWIESYRFCLAHPFAPLDLYTDAYCFYVWTIVCADTANLVYEHCESRRALWDWLHCCAPIGLLQQEHRWPGCCLFKWSGAGQIQMMTTPKV